MSTAPPWQVAAFVAMVAASSCLGALLLRAAPTRAEAWWVLPGVVAWGLAVVAFAPGLPRAEPLRVAAASLAIRLPWVGTPPLLSDDLYRYLWEGAALAAGHDPFLEPPSSIEGLDDALRGSVNHPDLTSVYPPLALWWFRLLALGGTPATAQLATAFVDAALAAVLAVAGRRPGLAWVYALLPLPVLESACGAHVDVPAAFLAALAVLAVRSERPVAALWLALAGAATKLFPVVFVPSLLRSLPARKAALHLALGGAAALGLTAGTVHLGPALGSSATLYASSWSFLGFVHPWVQAAVGEAARPLLVAAGAGWVAAVTWRSRDPAEVWAAAGGAFVLLSPTVHPWYVAWALIPSLLCGRMGWACAAVFSPLSYAVLATWNPSTGSWTEAPELWWLVWGPTLAGFAAGRWVQLRADAPPTTANPEA